ncbi:uncharacterized protein CPUR_07317 [Claviceps purpurea 20.1]|uniref:Integrase catalytic domain-containing protein n=1 Tax=Claviceps purpurea (strain 20.1) TaxID=1111077 RepID=M1WF67_CLAP2|nr:uncharacterized protein CPUR_07317 [Claviceps purpurea 20.1]
MNQLATEAPVLAFFKPGSPIIVECDISAESAGGVIWQEQDDKIWKLIGFSSTPLTHSQQTYPIQDQDVLAVMQVLKDNAQVLTGTAIVVLTDHRALTYPSSKRTLSKRQLRWSHYLANFDITWRRRPRKENVAADVLSPKTINNPIVKAHERLERDLVMVPADRVEGLVAAVEAVDARVIPRGAKLADLVVKENRNRRLGLHEGKLIVPETTADGRIYLRTALMREAHEPASFADGRISLPTALMREGREPSKSTHVGQNKTKASLMEKYWWKDLSAEVKRYVSSCRVCHGKKNLYDPPPGLLHPVPVRSRVWDTVIVEGKVMPTDVDGHDYVWAFICKSSRLIVTLPGKKNDKADMLAKRYYRRIYGTLGLPLAWISENGGSFIAEFMKMINKLTGTKHHQSSCHSQTEGGVHVANTDLDQRLQSHIDKYQTRWSEHLPSLDFEHNSSHHAPIGMSPLMAVTGSEPRKPLSRPMPEAGLNPEREQAASKLVKQRQDVPAIAPENRLEVKKPQENEANRKRHPGDWSADDSAHVSKKRFTTEAPTASQWPLKEEKGFSHVLDTPDQQKKSKLFGADRLRKAADDPLPQQYAEPVPPDEIDGQLGVDVDRILASL